MPQFMFMEWTNCQSIQNETIFIETIKTIWPHCRSVQSPHDHYLKWYEADRDVYPIYKIYHIVIDGRHDSNVVVVPTFLLTYLISHKNPINGFRPAATQSSTRLCFLSAFANWSHQSMWGLPRFGPSKGYKSSHHIPVSPEHPPSYERRVRANTAARY